MSALQSISGSNYCGWDIEPEETAPPKPQTPQSTMSAAPKPRAEQAFTDYRLAQTIGRWAPSSELRGSLASAELQLGLQNSFIAKGGTLERRGKSSSEQVSLLSVGAHLGTRNADGSRGVNAGVGASVVDAEATLGQASSITIGAKLGGAGGEFSVGLRDIDKNGKRELCVRAGVELMLGALIGVCIERP
jgi:hypothetical protein